MANISNKGRCIFLKVLAIIGSPRRGRTYNMVQRFEKQLKSYGKVEFEYADLRDYTIQPCRGCEVCLKQGDKFCPLQDDTKVIFEKMLAADGVIFATPNYALNVTALMKNLLDRLAYVFHRPCFFHKASIAMVTQGVYGDKEIIKYFESVCQLWGFNACKGIGLTTPSNELLPSEQEKINKTISKGAKHFYGILSGSKSPQPNFFMLWAFRFARTSHAKLTDKTYCDYHYFKTNGWFDSDYYYDVKLNPFKKLYGIFADKMAKKVMDRIGVERQG